MDAILHFLINWGYLGLFFGSFVAGSVLPFSSEAVLATCVGALGLDPMASVAAATAGNVAGGMTCYWIGHLGKTEWIETYFHIREEKIHRAERFIQGRGAYMAFFAFVPILGSAIAIVLGMMRANVWIVLLSMTTGKIFRYVLLVGGMWIGFSSCHSTRQTQPDIPVLTVTLEPFRYFTEAVAGDKFQVVSLVPEGSSPETYDPTPRQWVDLNRSKAYLRAGHIGFERVWMDRLTANAPQLKVFDTSEGIEPLYDDEGIEPHVWGSARNAAVIVGNICRALCELDSENTSYYQMRRDSLQQVFAQTDTVISRLLQRADTTFLIYHPALSYFARDYGRRQLCIEDGGKEPSPARLKELIDAGRRERVRVLFVQKEFDTRSAAIIAEELGIRIVPINPLSYDWQKELMQIAKALIP